MRKWSGISLLGGSFVVVSIVAAQPPGRPGDGPNGGPSADPSSFVTRMMTFDANQDGKLTKDEVTDERLRALFDRADANQDGVVTKDELTALYSKESSTLGRGGPGGGGGPGRGGPGGPGGPGMGGPGMGGPPPIGQVLPPHIQDRLNLSKGQKKNLDALQKLVDSKLDQILNDEQKQQLEEMRKQGPGGPGGFGRPGPGGPNGPGGPPGPGGNRGPAQ